MIPQFTFIDPVTGAKVDSPDYAYMETLEKILLPQGNPEQFRREIAQRFFNERDAGRLTIEENRSLLSSKEDEFLGCFEREYNKLLSHRKVEVDIDGAKLTEAFFLKQKDKATYEKLSKPIKDFAGEIIENMCMRFGYTPNIAFETLLFALRKGFVDFKKILN